MDALDTEDYGALLARHVARSCVFSCVFDFVVMIVLSDAMPRILRGRKTQWYNDTRGEDAEHWAKGQRREWPRI